MPRRRVAVVCSLVFIAALAATAPAQENSSAEARQAACKAVAAGFLVDQTYGPGPEGCQDGPPPCKQTED